MESGLLHPLVLHALHTLPRPSKRILRQRKRLVQVRGHLLLLLLLLALLLLLLHVSGVCLHAAIVAHACHGLLLLLRGLATEVAHIGFWVVDVKTRVCLSSLLGTHSNSLLM